MFVGETAAYVTQGTALSKKGLTLLFFYVSGQKNNKSTQSYQEFLNIYFSEKFFEFLMICTRKSEVRIDNSSIILHGLP